YTANPNFAVDKELVTTATSLLGYTPKIMISSWSPPAGIKGNNSVNGTDQNPVTSAPYPTLKNVNGGFVYTSFADWWKQSVLLYQQNGIYPDYISLQNEPNWNPGYEGCLFNATESANIAGFPQALSALRTSINTIGTNRPKILGPEVFGIGSDAFQNYVNNFLNVNDADALCYHQYTGGNPQSPDSFNSNLAAVGVTSASKGKQVFMSEYIGVTPSQDGKDTLSNTLNLAWLIHNNLTQANASAYIIWDLIWGGKSADIIGVENPWTPGSWSTPNGYLVQQQYYALKQYTKFVRSGWLRVDAGNNSTNFRTSSYRSIDGDSMAVVILNVGNSVGKMGLNLGNFIASSGLIYQTNGTNLQCSNTGIYMPGSVLTLPARSITTLTLNRNKNPLVSITSSGNNSTYISPSSIPLAVSATDSDGSLVSLKYYDNGTLLTTLTTAGFSFNWTNAALGIHTLTAVAMDNSGGTATSNPVFVRVNAPCVVPSTVSGFTGVTTICGSGNLVISAIPVASASGYIWTTTGVSIVSGQNTAALTVNVLTVGGTISVRPYNSCGTATGTSISINQFPNVAPGVTIASSATIICSGTGITFTATGLNGGTSPSFAWFRNNISIGTGTTINITPSNGDQITARMTAGGTFPTCLAS
ncbi:MAG: hypothetical protein K2Q22_13925, partial [Cytophagales bacterium]|nr:hypothetical protein [Cytophagales bacterium]